MPTGTIGNPLFNASRKPPRWKGSTRASSERTSSGKISTETPRARPAIAAAKLSRAVERSLRSIGTKPPAESAQPKTGIRNRLDLARNLVSPGRLASSAGMSNRLWWLAMKTLPTSPATAPSRSTSSRTKLAASSPFAQARPTR